MLNNVHHKSSPVAKSCATEVADHLIKGKKTFQSYFRKRLNNPDEAEDVFQDFCIKVIKARRSLEDNEKIDAWLGRILRNTLIDHYRRRAVRQKAETAFAVEAKVQEHESEETPDHAPCKCIIGALHNLKPEQSKLLRLADLEEEPRNQIASALGLTINNLNVRLFRARRALKEELESTCSVCSESNFLDCECG